MYTLLYQDGAHPRNRDELVHHYFDAGYTYDEIRCILILRHDINCSLRTLHRVLRKQNLRRNSPSDDTLQTFMVRLEAELQGSGQNLGCRSMARRMLTRYGLTVPRRIVLEGQRLLDPEGVELRKRHRLKRRLYSNKGPNYAVHIDQHDKLKVYGFAIHGAIDGFSRRLLWLRVAHTNNDPRVVASYFLDFLTDISGIPRCIQMDRGTENVLVEDIQVAFQSVYGDPDARCVIKSASPHNQRIERFWRTLFDMMVNFWVDTFRQMVGDGVLDCTSPLHIECMRYCFTKIIQLELDEVRIEWNQHRSRASRHISALPGKPDIMYFMPELYDTLDYRLPVTVADIQDVKEEFTTSPPANGCSNNTEEIFNNLMAAHDKGMPSSPTEAMELFQWMCDKFEV